MMKKPFDVCVFIGRMQPPTVAHIANIKKAADIADNALVLFGSAYQPRTIKNPFTWQERATMVFDSIGPEYADVVTARGIRDYLYNNSQWAVEVQKLVNQATMSDNARVAIIGHKKDSSSFYLDMFPQWEFIEVDNVSGANATDIRNAYFSGRLGIPAIAANWNLAPSVVTFLETFGYTQEYTRLSNELYYIEEYKKAASVAPYPPTYVTADAVVEQSGHVLMIKRKAAPGEGLWALPGGFVNQEETIEDAAIRELREETKLKVPAPVLRGSIEWSHVFDAPHRSLRGRTITHAYLFRLPPGELPKVKGGDDAREARWFPIDELMKMESVVFEDHMSIIRKLLGV